MTKALEINSTPPSSEAKFRQALKRLAPLTDKIDAFTNALREDPFSEPILSFEEVAEIQRDRTELFREIGVAVYTHILDGGAVHFVSEGAPVTPLRVVPREDLEKPADGEPDEAEDTSVDPTTASPFATLEWIIQLMGNPRERPSDVAESMDHFFSHHASELLRLDTVNHILAVECLVAGLRWAQDLRGRVFDGTFAKARDHSKRHRPGFMHGFALHHQPRFGDSWRDDYLRLWGDLNVAAVEMVTQDPDQALDTLEETIHSDVPSDLRDRVITHCIEALGWRDQGLVECLADSEGLLSGKDLKRLRKAKRRLDLE